MPLLSTIAVFLLPIQLELQLSAADTCNSATKCGDCLGENSGSSDYYCNKEDCTTFDGSPKACSVNQGTCCTGSDFSCDASTYTNSKAQITNADSCPKPPPPTNPIVLKDGNMSARVEIAPGATKYFELKPLATRGIALVFPT